ncbi:4Fe-4S binding protein, partial [Paracoccus sp. APAP_BH8]|uniref:4Fe-4S binding protein n=1 Tax=Paracoccus sp. APAP_BH8 TaxID=3110237 RepID=UPI003FA6831A
ENCIGCGYCVTGCPFDIPRISQKTHVSYKCTLWARDGEADQHHRHHQAQRDDGRGGREDVLASWLDEAADSMIASFARGLRSDCAAVAAALREPWSSDRAAPPEAAAAADRDAAPLR